MKRILAAAAFSLVASVACAQVQSEMAELKKLNVAIGLPTNAKNTATDGTSVTLTSILKQISFSIQAVASSVSAVALNASVDQLEGYLDGVEGFVDGLEGNTDGLEGQVGIVTETAPATDTASSGLNGRLQRVAQRLTTLITAVGTPFQAGGTVILGAGTAAFGKLAANAGVIIGDVNVVGTVPLPTGASTLANQTSVIGSKAGTAATNALLIGGVNSTTLPTMTDNQQVALQMTTRGSVIAQLYNGAVAITGSADNADAVAETSSANAMKVATRPYVYNSAASTWERQRGNTFGAFGIIRDAAGNARGVNVNASNEMLVAATISGLPASLGSKADAASLAVTQSTEDKAQLQLVLDRLTAIEALITAREPAALGTGGGKLSELVDSAGNPVKFNSPAAGDLLTPYSATTTSGECFAEDLTGRERILRNTGTARVGVGFADEVVTILTATYVMDPGGSVTTGKDGYVGPMRCVAESGTQAVAKTIMN